MMTGREAMLAVLNHETADYMPNYINNVLFCGGSKEDFENRPSGGGLDGFGVMWHSSDSAGGQAVPAANWVVLDDVTKWRDVVRFPDLDDYDWESEAERQKANYDPVNQILEYHSWNSQFLRVTHLMGFENGLCAFAEEPEACRDLTVWRQRGQTACRQHNAARDSRGGQVCDKGQDAVHRAVDCDKHLQFGGETGNSAGAYCHHGGKSDPSFPHADSIPHGAKREREGAEHRGDAADRGRLQSLRPGGGKPGGVLRERKPAGHFTADADRDIP